MVETWNWVCGWKQLGLRTDSLATAVGYYWHPPCLGAIPSLIDKEKFNEGA